MQGIVIIANILVLIGVIGLVRSGAAGDSRLAKIGLRIAALLLPFEVLVTVNEEVFGMRDWRLEAWMRYSRSPIPHPRAESAV